MSVYTAVSAEDLDAWLARYAVGALADFEPIAAGIENTNYFVTTGNGRYVLTLYERLPAEDLPFYLNFMAHLARSGCEVPAPVPDRTGAFFSILNGKPAGLVERVDGSEADPPTAHHCAAVGAALGRLHVASQSVELFDLMKRDGRVSTFDDLIPVIARLSQLCPLLGPMAVISMTLNAQQNGVIEFAGSAVLFRKQVVNVVAGALVAIGTLEKGESSSLFFRRF